MPTLITQSMWDAGGDTDVESGSMWCGIFPRANKFQDEYSTGHASYSLWSPRAIRACMMHVTDSTRQTEILLVNSNIVRNLPWRAYWSTTALNLSTHLVHACHCELLSSHKTPRPASDFQLFCIIQISEGSHGTRDGIISDCSALRKHRLHLGCAT